MVTALCRFVVQKQLISGVNTSFVMGRMIIVAGIEIQIAVIAVNLPALRSLFIKLVGSSHDPLSYDQGEAHKLSSRKGDSIRSPKRFSDRFGNFQEGRRGTLTGSEEELVQYTHSTKDILVVTNVNIDSRKVVNENASAS